MDLVNKKDYKLEPFFHDASYTKVRVKVKDLLVRVYKGRGSFIVGPIENSPAYKYLQTGNDDYYINYHKMVKQLINEDDTHSLYRFKKLISKIKKEGYDTKKPILVSYTTKGYEIIDGQHRASILYRLDKEQEIEVLQWVM